MPEIMASQLRVFDWPFVSRLSLFMGLEDSPNRCTKVKWATLWGCRQHLLYFGAAILYSKPFIFLTPRGIFFALPLYARLQAFNAYRDRRLPAAMGQGAKVEDMAPRGYCSSRVPWTGTWRV